jgi:hypothetical protein
MRWEWLGGCSEAPLGAAVGCADWRTRATLAWTGLAEYGQIKAPEPLLSQN